MKWLVWGLDLMDAVRMVAEFAKVDSASITHATPLADLTGWDSLKLVRLVVTLETEIGRELSETELETLMTVGDVDALLPKN